MVASKFKGVLYHRKDGKILFTKKFMQRACTFIEFSNIYENKYQVCDCHFEYSIPEDLEDDEDYFALPNLSIDKAPIIIVKPNDFTKYGIYITCDDCGCTKTIDLDVFVDLTDGVVIVKDLDKFIEEQEANNPLNVHPNVKQIPVNRKPRVKQDKQADIIYLKEKKETQ